MHQEKSVKRFSMSEYGNKLTLDGSYELMADYEVKFKYFEMLWNCYQNLIWKTLKSNP